MQNIELKKINRPKAVWVFGVLNIVLGSRELYYIILGFHKEITNFRGERTISGMSYFFAAYGFMLSIIVWGLIVGIFLLLMTKRARRGAIVYAYVRITLGVILTFISIIWFPFSIFPKNELGHLIFRIGLNTAEVLIFPVLLLIFMKSAKVKQAFARIENE